MKSDSYTSEFVPSTARLALEVVISPPLTVMTAALLKELLLTAPKTALLDPCFLLPCCATLWLADTAVSGMATVEGEYVAA